jgi:endoglucanase
MLRAQGTNWVNPSGARVDLRGLNLGNWLQLEFWMMANAASTSAGVINDQCTLENALTSRFGWNEKERLMDAFRDSWMTDRDWNNIRALGFNVVRVPFWFNLIENENAPYTLRADAWQYLDLAINKAAERGMYVILDLHGAVGSQGHEHHSGCAGRNWYWAGGNGQTAAHYQDRTRWLWTQIATRYRNNGNVAGYGLLNEPWGTDAVTLANNITSLYQAVRAVDPNHVIILPGHNTGGIDAYGTPSSRGMSNVAFEAHFYPGFWGWREGEDATLVHSDWLHCSPQRTGEVCDWQNRLNGLQTPFLVGEFQPWTALGANGGEITRKTFDIYNSMGWAATAWSYKTVSTTAHTGNGNNGWPWGLITNTSGFGTINVSTATAAQIESWFRGFATQSVVTHPDIAYWMAYQPRVGATIEAEHFKFHFGARIEATTDPIGGDFNASYLDTNDWMTYVITIPTTGWYNLQYRVASPGGGSVILGRDGTNLVTTPIPATGGWQTWQTVTSSVYLNAGTQSLTVWVAAGGWNLNWWMLTPQ